MLSFLFVFQSCLADDGLDQELRKAADTIADFLSNNQLQRVSLRKFEGPASFPASSGPGIAETIIRTLRSKGLEVVGVSKKADVAVTGKYRLQQSDNGPIRPKMLAMIVVITLEDDLGNPLQGFGKQGTIEVTSKKANEIAETMGITVPMDSKSGSKEQRNERDHALLISTYSKPKAAIQNGDEAKSEESPYGVQVLVRGKPVPMSDLEGLVYCPLSRGDEFEILLRNDSDFEAAVELKLDGINAFFFSELRAKSDETLPLYVHYIIPKKSKAAIKGWHMTNEAVRAFRITGFEESAAMQANADQGVGTITASFSAAWTGNDLPPGELVERGEGKQSDFIGFGDIKQFSVTAVPRQIGQVREVIAIDIPRRRK